MAAYKKHNNQLTLHGSALDTINMKSINRTFQAIHTALFDMEGNNTIHSMSLDMPENNYVSFSNTVGTGRIIMNESGWYDLSYRAGYKYKKHHGKKKTLTQIKTSLLKNSYDEIEVTVTWTGNSDKNKHGANTWRGLLYFEAGDYIELIIQSMGGNKIKARTQKSVISITKI